ncbi:MAG: hypothetical protein IT364_01395 [Candidatus Hydrogenedentes bacterium]|nr:hypothetical protein [Candidatus Hydrogenedentota bacterium]
MCSKPLTLAVTVLLSALAGGAVAASLLAPRVAEAQSSVVRGERFELVDAAGAVTATLGPGHNAAPRLTLFGKDGKPSILLAVNPVSGGNIFMLDSEERARVNLLVTPDGQPFLHFLDAEERGRASFGLTVEGDPKLYICDKDGTPRATLRVAPDGTPGLDYADAAPPVLPSNDPNEAP